MLLAIPVHAIACGGQPIAPAQAEAESTSALLRARDFATLDSRAADYRKLTALMSDGQPKLIGFYLGLYIVDSDCGTDAADPHAWAEHRELLTEWKNVSRDATAPTLALASVEKSVGWKARGTGFASTVTEEGWKVFREQLAIAKDMLEKLGPAARDDPEWYDAMLGIGLAQGWTTARFDILYAEAIKKYPSYFSLFFTKGLYYNTKWHGSPEEFRAFVETTVNNTKGRLGQTMYARLHWSAHEGDMFESGKTDWKRMKAGFERIIADYPDAWNRNSFAKFACLAGDNETLREQLRLIGNDIVTDAWDSAQTYHYCTRRVALNATGMLPLRH